MKDNYIVVYSGKLLPKTSSGDVIHRVSILLKIPMEKAEALVTTNQSKILKRNVSYEIAQKYQKALMSTGMEITIEIDSGQNSSDDHIHQKAKKENNKILSGKESLNNSINIDKS